ncbi:DUF5009 domain-containing protein [Ornithobacterium rhinotracheale]|uniref:acyltransferase family protein n=1 Tax=Ornithobacterium rhinotracheale TaxID=28251 RepID=UPI00129C7DD3|nr:DUF5009 domain-containing protein [Ornithobacterium rhinotracheale]MRJ07404.1 DUF5009 domain-containing protein [Ornithobacterium rhinotracheale]UOH78001.1 DUF5009 domain-containing protein [Ornithobacterium rhinotracheale]
MKPRYYSLDVFRGATVALMILVNNPGSWSAMFKPLTHAEWAGCTPTDLVFPFFLFAVGNAMAFVIPRLQKAGSQVFWRKVLKRTFLIFIIGLLLNWFPFVQWQDEGLAFKNWENVRILGVLQRIAFAYFFAAVIAYYFKEKKVLIISFLLLIVYWLLALFLGGADPYSMQGFWGTKVDLAILGESHMYHGEGVPFDPEGFVGAISSTAQVLLGYLAGKIITAQGEVNWLFVKAPKTSELHYKVLSMLFVSAGILLVVAYVWQLDFPIIKKIWSSTYVLHTTGLAIITISIMIWFIEVLKAKNFLTQFFDVFGKNPLFIFVLSGLIPRLLALVRIPTHDGFTTPLKYFYTTFCKPLSTNENVGSFVYSVVFLVAMWSIAYLLDRKKIYIKV